MGYSKVEKTDGRQHVSPKGVCKTVKPSLYLRPGFCLIETQLLLVQSSQTPACFQGLACI